MYGGLYEWGEAVQYQDGASNNTSPIPAFTGNIQGICPTGFNIPSEDDFRTLEMYLGMSLSDAIKINAYRGTDQGTQLKFGGSSQWEGLLGGVKSGSSFFYIGTFGDFTTSLEVSSTNYRHRALDISQTGVNSSQNGKTAGISVRCIKN